MEGSGNLPSKLTNSLTDWTLVDKEGDIVPLDGESDSSESSIEVVSVEGSDVVSFHHGRKETNPESVQPFPEDNGDQMANCLERSGGGDSLDKPTDTAAVTVDSSSQSPKDDVQMAQEILRAGTDTTVADVKPKHASSCDSLIIESASEQNPDMMMMQSNHDSVSGVNTADAGSVPLEFPPERVDEAGFGSVDLSKGASAVSGDSSPQTDMTQVEDVGGACCMELLYNSERDTVDTRELQESGPDVNVPSGEAPTSSQVSSKAPSSRGDSDTDSDFVQLNAENVEDFEAHMAASLETDGEPLPLRRYNSIDDNFRFMRGEEAEIQEVPPPPPMVNNHPPHPMIDNDDEEEEGNAAAGEDVDRDDETESFTEEGEDDRIESDQSEAESAQDEAGDLSAFADIGDIPLVTGDVPRNYIHRPNNHLSMVLNVTLVLAAILTMGISLGIIMATDLEIEEWQNAYDIQTIRVKQLELQLKDKKSQADPQKVKVTQLETLTWQLKARLAEARLQNLEYKKTRRALDWLEAHGVVEGGHFSHAAYLVRGVIHVFLHCGEEYDDLTSGSINDGDNGSYVPLGPCSEQLEDYMQKLRALAGSQRKSDEEAGRDSEPSDEHGDVSELNRQPQGEKYEESVDSGDLIGNENTEGEDISVGSGNSQTSVESQRAENSIREVQEQGKVELDIGQLQQSLSREQERALHWQSLYLFERRQRERERENEEWEDERDRLQWEEWERRETQGGRSTRPDLDELECLRKVLASNLTTLTQYVARWNVSVFDDFANLSILLSSVHDLKQSVVETVHKAWDSAEEAFEKMQGSSGGNDGSRTNSEGGSDHFSRKEDFAAYLLRVMQAVREKSGPQLEELLWKVQSKLTKMKEGLQNLGDEVNTAPFADHLEHVWNATGEILAQVQTDVNGMLPHKEVLMEYMRNLLDSFTVDLEEGEGQESGYEHNGAGEESAFEHEGQFSERSDLNSEVRVKDDHDGGFDLNIGGDGSHTENRHKNQDGDEDDDDDDDDHDEDDDDHDEDDNKDEEDTYKSKEYGGDRKASWSKGIGKIWSRTHKSFKQLGRKVRNTFGEIHNIWHKKDQPLLRIAKHLTSKFVRASVKLTEMCTKLPSTLFKDNHHAKRKGQMLIHSKCVKKLRKQWQKQLLKNPCQTAGDLSPECNLDRKALKHDVKEVSKLFYHLMKIKTFEPEITHRMSYEDVRLHHELFKSFLERWGSRHLLLKKDLEWAVCQRDWWSRVLQASSDPDGGKGSIGENKCDALSSHATFFPGGDIEEIRKAKVRDEKKDRNDGDKEDIDDDDVKVKDKRARYKRSQYESSDKKNDTNTLEPGASTETSADWYSARARYRLHNRREKEKKLARRISTFAHKPDSFQDYEDHKKKYDSRKGKADLDDMKDDWFSKKAQDRERLRRDHRRSEWMFERTKHRRHEDDEEWDRKRRDHDDDGDHTNEENWALKHGHFREQQREEEHQSDWLFNRASDRKEQRRSVYHYQNQHCGKGRGKHGTFRCAYGKVSSP